MAADAHETHFALLPEAIEGFVERRRHQSVETVALMNDADVEVIGLQTLQAAFDRGDDVGYRRVLGQVPGTRAELRGDEDLVAVRLERPADHLLAAGLAVVG